MNALDIEIFFEFLITKMSIDVSMPPAEKY